MQGLCTQDVSQGRLGQQPGGVVRVLHVGHGDGGIGDAVVDDGIDGHCHGVSGQDLHTT